MDELGIVNASGKKDDVSLLARSDLYGKPLEQICGGIAHDTQIIQKRAKIVRPAALQRSLLFPRLWAIFP